MLSEVEREGGKARIVYRPGGEVDVGELADLCSKVGWPKRPSEKVAGALENSYLVRPYQCHSTLCNRDELNAVKISLPRVLVECCQTTSRLCFLCLCSTSQVGSLSETEHSCGGSIPEQQGNETMTNVMPTQGFFRRGVGTLNAALG